MVRIAFAAACAFLALAGCGGPGGGGAAQPADATDTRDAGQTGDGGHAPPYDSDAYTDDAVALGEQVFRHRCAACHTMGHGPTRRGPDLLTVQLKPPMWLTNWIRDPAAWAERNPYAQRIIEQWGRTMPTLGLTDEELDGVIGFLYAQQALGPLDPAPIPTLDDVAREQTAAVYFDHCAGCHGTLRAGGTGPSLQPDVLAPFGSDMIASVLRHGTPWGMPAWGDSGVISEDTVRNLTAFLLEPVPEAPGLSIDQMRDSWELLVPVAERPTEPQHDLDWENFFGVVLRDSGIVAIHDGETHQQVAQIDAGRATHILRSSADGRYLHAVGRDGWIVSIDLFADPPAPVARVRGCWDARSIDVSRHEGLEDRYLIEGCYWPPQYAIFDGLTLEPLHVGEVRRDVIETGELLEEARVAAIVSSPHHPEWIIANKETGYVSFVSYATDDFPVVAELPAARFLHDGGLDRSGRYLLLAANASDRMVAVDLQERSIAAIFETGAVPHPGRGANWEDPEYGWVMGTGHIGTGRLTVFGADPLGAPEHAWQVVRSVELPSAGSLFLKTHPNSPWVLVDMTLSDNPELARQICAYSKASGELDRCFELAETGRIVHPEFNREGTEVWLSHWADPGSLIVLDAQTLEVIDRIEGVPSPTGKFNVYNTVHDVY